MKLLYATFKNSRECEKICTRLLEKRLIACVNSFRLDSSFLWKGKIKKAKEVGAFIKTSENNLKKVVETIKKMHSYEIPELIDIPCNSLNLEFTNWLEKELECKAPQCD